MSHSTDGGTARSGADALRGCAYRSVYGADGVFDRIPTGRNGDDGGRGATNPEPQETSAYLACYDEAEEMFAFRLLPDAPIAGRDTVVLSDFFASRDVSDMRRCKLFLLENSALRPVCAHWEGNPPA